MPAQSSLAAETRELLAALGVDRAHTTTGTLIVETARRDAPARITVTTRRVGVDESGAFWGMQFKQLTSACYLAVADVMYGHAAVLDDFRERRRSGKSLVAGSFQFVGWAFAQTGRAVKLAARPKPSAHEIALDGDLVPVSARDDKTRFG